MITQSHVICYLYEYKLMNIYTNIYLHFALRLIISKDLHHHLRSIARGNIAHPRTRTI